MVFLSQVAVPFRDLVFEDQLVSKCVPRQIRNNSMILMAILEGVREDDIRREFSCDAFELIFYDIELRREVAVAKLVQPNCVFSARSQEFVGTKVRLVCARSCRAPHNPQEFRSWTCASQLHNGAATADFDVVRMGAKAKNSKRFRSGSEK